MIGDERSLAAAIRYGRELADLCACLNSRQIAAVEEKLAKELDEKLAEKVANLKAETKHKAYGTDTVYAIGAEDLRAILSERESEPDIDSALSAMEYSFTSRLQEGRESRRKVKSSPRKARLGGAGADICIRSNT